MVLYECDFCYYRIRDNENRTHCPKCMHRVSRIEQEIVFEMDTELESEYVLDDWAVADADAWSKPTIVSDIEDVYRMIKLYPFLTYKKVENIDERQGLGRPSYLLYRKPIIEEEN